MSLLRSLFFATALASVYLAYRIGRPLMDVPPVPVLDEDAWFGPGTPEYPPSKFTLRPFTIQISDEVIADLNERLDRYLRKNVTPPLLGQGFEYGFNSDYLRQVVRYWRNEYSWDKRQEFLNRYPQFKVKINGLDIHFIHVKPPPTTGKTVVPLLLIHGWPSTFQEFFRAIPLLMEIRSDVDFVFDLVVPSLPGFGFSQASVRPGLGAAEMAVIMKKLMTGLGHTKFYVAGGDWGSVVGKNLAILYPDSVLGMHSNMCFVLSFGVTAKWILGSIYPPIAIKPKFYHKIYPWMERFKFILEEFGYFHMQATKPDTIGPALEDSPAGLASYILEKYSTWTNPGWTKLPDGGLTRRYTMDELLDNVMIFWVTNSITSSLRLYKETMSDRHLALKLEQIPIRVPTVCIRYEHEIFWMSTELIDSIYQNIIHLRDVNDTGHYPAFERPKKFTDDIWTGFKILLAVRDEAT